MLYAHTYHPKTYSCPSHPNAYTKTNASPSHTHSHYHTYPYPWAFSYANVVSTFPYSHPNAYYHPYPVSYLNPTPYPNTYAVV